MSDTLTPSHAPTVAAPATAGEPAEPPRRRRKGAHERMIPMATFKRIVRDIADKCKWNVRMEQHAVFALKEATEHMLLNKMRHAQALAELGKTRQLQKKHLTFACGDILGYLDDKAT